MDDDCSKDSSMEDRFLWQGLSELLTQMERSDNNIDEFTKHDLNQSSHEYDDTTSIGSETVGSAQIEFTELLDDQDTRQKAILLGSSTTSYCNDTVFGLYDSSSSFGVAATDNHDYLVDEDNTLFVEVRADVSCGHRLQPSPDRISLTYSQLSTSNMESDEVSEYSCSSSVNDQNVREESSDNVPVRIDEYSHSDCEIKDATKTVIFEKENHKTIQTQSDIRSGVDGEKQSEFVQQTHCSVVVNTPQTSSSLKEFTEQEAVMYKQTCFKVEDVCHAEKLRLHECLAGEIACTLVANCIWEAKIWVLAAQGISPSRSVEAHQFDEDDSSKNNKIIGSPTNSIDSGDHVFVSSKPTLNGLRKTSLQCSVDVIDKRASDGNESSRLDMRETTPVEHESFYDQQEFELGTQQQLYSEISQIHNRKCLENNETAQEIYTSPCTPSPRRLRYEDNHTPETIERGNYFVQSPDETPQNRNIPNRMEFIPSVSTVEFNVSDTSPYIDNKPEIEDKQNSRDKKYLHDDSVPINLPLAINSADCVVKQHNLHPTRKDLSQSTINSSLDEPILNSFIENVIPKTAASIASTSSMGVADTKSLDHPIGTKIVETNFERCEEVITTTQQDCKATTIQVGFSCEEERVLETNSDEHEKFDFDCDDPGEDSVKEDNQWENIVTNEVSSTATSRKRQITVVEPGVQGYFDQTMPSNMHSNSVVRSTMNKKTLKTANSQQNQGLYQQPRMAHHKPLKLRVPGVVAAHREYARKTRLEDSAFQRRKQYSMRFGRGINLQQKAGIGDISSHQRTKLSHSLRRATNQASASYQSRKDDTKQHKQETPLQQKRKQHLAHTSVPTTNTSSRKPAVSKQQISSKIDSPLLRFSEILAIFQTTIKVLKEKSQQTSRIGCLPLLKNVTKVISFLSLFPLFV